MSARELPEGLAADLEEYEDWMIGMNWSEQTVWARLRAARFFLAEWGTWDVRPSVVAASLRRYAGWTARTYFLSLRTAFGWAVETGRVQVDPTARMKAPATPRPQPKPLDPETLQRMVDTATGRARAYMLLAFLAGLRAHEIAKLRGEDVTPDGIHVVGKGGKVATIPTHPALWALAQDYPRQGYWFTSHMGDRGPVTVKAVQQTVRLHLRAHGVATGTIHQFRASYGTELLRAGANIRVVQDLMRHSSLSSTEHYLGVSDTERRDAIAGLRSDVEVPSLGGGGLGLPAGFTWAANVDDATAVEQQREGCEGGCCVTVRAPCPPWCETGAGHPYDHRSEPLTRIHTRGYGYDVVLEALHEAAAYDGPEVVVEAAVAIPRKQGEPHTPLEGRGLAAAVVTASADLERLGLADLPDAG